MAGSPEGLSFWKTKKPEADSVVKVKLTLKSTAFPLCQEPGAVSLADPEAISWRPASKSLTGITPSNIQPESTAPLITKGPLVGESKEIDLILTGVPWLTVGVRLVEGEGLGVGVGSSGVGVGSGARVGVGVGLLKNGTLPKSPFCQKVRPAKAIPPTITTPKIANKIGLTPFLTCGGIGLVGGWTGAAIGAGTGGGTGGGEPGSCSITYFTTNY